MKHRLTPKRPNPATVMPLTAPPRKAIRSAGARPPVLAALVVVAFALVVINNPTKPAVPEKIAPTT